MHDQPAPTETAPAMPVPAMPVPDLAAATTGPIPVIDGGDGDGMAAQSWTLRRRLGGVFGGLAILGAVIIAALVFSTILFVRAGNTVIYRWQPAVQAGQRLLTDYIDQETGVRGFVLGVDRSFLAPYTEALSEQAQDAAQLRTLLGGDARLRSRLDDLLSAGTAWQRAAALPAIAAVSSRDTAGAAAIVNGPATVIAFEQIRASATALQTDVLARARSARKDRTVAGYVFVISVSVALLLLIASGIGVWRGLHRWVLGPVDRLRSQSRAVASGELSRSIVSDGPVELTDLGTAVEAMRLRIGSELSRAEQVMDDLRAQGLELARSNDDLQQFAYVASHDLSEPLRKVANFCQLLERQYSDQLDDRARQYIDFAVDGAKRMQVLITDLLALSRVGRSTAEFVPVDLDAALNQALRTLEDKISDAGARVERSAPLPTVNGDRTLLTSLLENLVGNAVKYRRDDVAPIVSIGVETPADAATWTFTVTDNGIGIDREYAERIFAVFQRLHLRDQYGGTGIGLALCRRIVEFHGGSIWLGEARADVESEPGATFRFTLPAPGIAEVDHAPSPA